MSEYQVDFSDVVSTRYLAPGVYQVALRAVEEKEGRQAPLFEWIFADATGAQSRITTSLADAALWKLQEVLIALGVDASGQMSVSLQRFRKLIGRSATATVVAEEGDNGKTYSKIAHLARSQGAPAPAAAPADDFKDIDFANDDIPF